MAATVKELEGFDFNQWCKDADLETLIDQALVMRQRTAYIEKEMKQRMRDRRFRNNANVLVGKYIVRRGMRVGATYTVSDMEGYEAVVSELTIIDETELP